MPRPTKAICLPQIVFPVPADVFFCTCPNAKTVHVVSIDPALTHFALTFHLGKLSHFLTSEPKMTSIGHLHDHFDRSRENALTAFIHQR